MYRRPLTGFQGILGREDAETQLVASRLPLLDWIRSPLRCRGGFRDIYGDAMIDTIRP
jgi:hypothetical protein